MNGKKIALFAHYDKRNIIAPYVLNYIKKLSEVATVVFISDCNLAVEEIEKASPFCIKVIAKHHGMYDFGSYKIGYNYIAKDLEKYEELILCNDSCYGPLCSFVDIWKKMDNQKCDFWGISENKLPKKHIQSYFIVLKRNIFLQDFLQNL